MLLRLFKRLLPATALSIALLPALAAAQTPANPASAASAGAVPGLATPAPPAGFFGAVGGKVDRCAACWKRSTLHKLLKNALAPLKLATGGLIGGGHDEPPLPPPGAPNAPPPPPAVSAAAKIKIDAAQAAARVDAVRFLATVDCHWYPEAEDGLIASLRADRSECVRLEAARALGRGCCCTKKTMAALLVSAAGSSSDGNPGERCPRVRWAALEALQVCMMQCQQSGFPQQDRPFLDRPESPSEPLASPDGNDAIAAEWPAARNGFYAQAARRPTAELLREAQLTIAQLAPQQAVAPAAPIASQRSLYGIWAATGNRQAESHAQQHDEQPAEHLTDPTYDDYYAAILEQRQQAAAAAGGQASAYPIEEQPGHGRGSLYGAIPGGSGAVQPASAPIYVGDRAETSSWR